MKSTEDIRECALRSANQGAYDKCNIPRSAAEAEADLDGFALAVYLLRMEFRIPELVLGASVPVEGEEKDRAATVILGNRAHTAPRIAALLLRHVNKVSQIILEETGASATR